MIYWEFSFKKITLETFVKSTLLFEVNFQMFEGHFLAPRTFKGLFTLDFRTKFIMNGQNSEGVNLYFS